MLIKCSLCLYLRFNTLSFFHVVRVSLSSTCYLLKQLSKVKAVEHTDTTSDYCVYTCNTADTATLYINCLIQILLQILLNFP